MVTGFVCMLLPCITNKHNTKHTLIYYPFLLYDGNAELGFETGTAAISVSACFTTALYEPWCVCVSVHKALHISDRRTAISTYHLKTAICTPTVSTVADAPSVLLQRSTRGSGSMREGCARVAIIDNNEVKLRPNQTQ